MMSQKELQKYAEQDYKLVDPEYIKQLERDSERLIRFKKYSIIQNTLKNRILKTIPSFLEHLPIRRELLQEL